jgi:RNA polymerase sigma factor for flagellar operon FliA
VNVPALGVVEGDARKALDKAQYERFLPIVRRIAMRAARRVPRHIAVADLVSCGWLGLMEAFHRAAPGMAAEEFEAYASYRIRGAMLDYLRSLDTGSKHMRRASRDLSRAIKNLGQSLGRAPTEGEIAQSLGMTEPGYQEHLARLSEAGMTRLELFDFDHDKVDAGVEPADETLAHRQLADALADAVTQLPARLQVVLALYYQEECTLKEIGAVLNLSESMISRLHTEAVHRLRAAIGRE